ncbi:MAG: hypothetical protein LQ350_005648 [Teloschistes chrysophthalmus]|nr:MAG: hypothetical protein LQ350_005648 [Niorma chrysophthalma]
MDDMIGENNDRHFQYLGCSGALTNTIREKQVPKMQQSQAVLLSAGGNDAHLSTLLNYCVYQWTAIWPWTCDGELSKAEADVNSDSYLKSMTEMLKAIEGKLVDGNSRIYWAGYMRFFDTSTNECDEVTWAFTRVFGFRQFLTQARRERFNKITDLVNQKIQDACKTVDRCVYVDSEPEVDRNAGRYCMPGINEHYYGGIESPIDGWNRERTVYYEWSTTKDNDADDEKNIDQPQKREEMGQRGESFISLDRRSDTPGPLDNSTFEGAIGNWIIQGTQDGTLNVSATQFGEVNAQGLPDWIGRVFHLTKYGNAIVANGILRAMIAEQAKMMNQPADPFIIDPAQCHISGAEIDKLPPPAPAPAPYVVTGGNGAQAGKCHVHVSEYEKCGPDTSDLSTEVTIYDVGGNKIGFQSVKVAGATDPLPVKSKLEDLLIVTPEHRGNYIQFTLGTENFNSRQSDQMALAWCNTGGWDPREGPSCGGRIPQRSSVSTPYFLHEYECIASDLIMWTYRNGKWTAISSAHGMEASLLMALNLSPPIIPGMSHQVSASSCLFGRLPNELLESILFQLPDLYSLKAFLSAYGPSAVGLVGRYLYAISRSFAVRENWPIMLRLELGRITIVYETGRIHRWHSQDLVVEAEYLIDAVRLMTVTAEAALAEIGLL